MVNSVVGTASRADDVGHVTAQATVEVARIYVCGVRDATAAAGRRGGHARRTGGDPQPAIAPDTPRRRLYELRPLKPTSQVELFE